MFAKENKRKGEKRSGRDPDLGRHLWESWYRYLHPHRLLSRFIGILCYSQASSLLIPTLFSLIELFLWSYNFLGGIFYLYDGKMASLMTSLNSRLERQQRRICIGETSAILYFAGMKQTKIMKIKTIKKRNTRRPGVNMKKKVASHFEDWSITESHVAPHIYYSTNRIKCNKWTTNNREDLFICLFIYLIAFTIITMLKKTRGKKYIWTRHKNDGRRCALTENTQILTM